MGFLDWLGDVGDDIYDKATDIGSDIYSKGKQAYNYIDPEGYLSDLLQNGGPMNPVNVIQQSIKHRETPLSLVSIPKKVVADIPASFASGQDEIQPVEDLASAALMPKPLPGDRRTLSIPFANKIQLTDPGQEAPGQDIGRQGLKKTFGYGMDPAMYTGLGLEGLPGKAISAAFGVQGLQGAAQEAEQGQYLSALIDAAMGTAGLAHAGKGLSRDIPEVKFGDYSSRSPITFLDPRTFGQRDIPNFASAMAEGGGVPKEGFVGSIVEPQLETLTRPRPLYRIVAEHGTPEGGWLDQGRNLQPSETGRLGQGGYLSQETDNAPRYAKMYEDSNNPRVAKGDVSAEKPLFLEEPAPQDLRMKAMLELNKFKQSGAEGYSPEDLAGVKHIILSPETTAQELSDSMSHILNKNVPVEQRATYTGDPLSDFYKSAGYDLWQTGRKGSPAQEIVVTDPRRQFKVGEVYDPRKGSREVLADTSGVPVPKFEVPVEEPKPLSTHPDNVAKVYSDTVDQTLKGFPPEIIQAFKDRANSRTGYPKDIPENVFNQLLEKHGDKVLEAHELIDNAFDKSLKDKFGGLVHTEVPGDVLNTKQKDLEVGPLSEEPKSFEQTQIDKASAKAINIPTVIDNLARSLGYKDNPLSTSNVIGEKLYHINTRRPFDYEKGEVSGPAEEVKGLIPGKNLHLSVGDRVTPEWGKPGYSESEFISRSDNPALVPDQGLQWHPLKTLERAGIISREEFKAANDKAMNGILPSGKVGKGAVRAWAAKLAKEKGYDPMLEYLNAYEKNGITEQQLGEIHKKAITLYAKEHPEVPIDEIDLNRIPYDIWKRAGLRNISQMPLSPNMVRFKSSRVIPGEDTTTTTNPADIMDPAIGIVHDPSEPRGPVKPRDLNVARVQGEKQTPLQTFEASQEKKYGRDWKEKQSPEEQAFHEKLSKGSEGAKFTPLTPEQQSKATTNPEEVQPPAEEVLRKFTRKDGTQVTHTLVDGDLIKVEKHDKDGNLISATIGSSLDDQLPIGNQTKPVGNVEPPVEAKPTVPMSASERAKAGLEPDPVVQNILNQLKSTNKPVEKPTTVSNPLSPEVPENEGKSPEWIARQKNLAEIQDTKDQLRVANQQLAAGDREAAQRVTALQSQLRDQLKVERDAKAQEAKDEETRNKIIAREKNKVQGEGLQEDRAREQAHLKALRDQLRVEQNKALDGDKEAKKRADAIARELQDHAKLIDKITREQNKEEIQKQKAKIKSETDPNPKSLLDDITDLPKTLRAAFDISYSGRQGLFLLNRPAAVKGMIEGGKSIYSHENHLAVNKELSERPNARLYETFGLNQIKYDPTEISQRNEQFPISGHIAEKIPGIAQSERAYTDQNNLSRANMFDYFTDKWKQQGKTPENRPDLYYGTAKYLNVLTGRDPLPKKLQEAGWLLNKVFWSPMFVKSRLQLLNPMFYYKLPKEVQKEAIRDVGGTLGTLTAVLSTLAYATKDNPDESKVKIETNPNHTDFGKARVGKTTYDLFTGLLPLIRSASRISTGEVVTRKGDYAMKGGGLFGNKEDKLPQAPFGGRTMIDELSLLGEGKLSPLISATQSKLKGVGYGGEKYGWPEFLRDTTIPMAPMDVIGAWKDYDAKEGLKNLPSIFGVGTRTDIPEDQMARPSSGVGKKHKRQYSF